MGRVTIVTGGAGDLGSAIARRLARDGDEVVVSDVADGAGVVAEIEAEGAVARFVRADVSDAEGVKKLVAEASSSAGRVDVVVNSHGVFGPQKPLESYTDREWEQIVEINLTGCFFVCRAVVPLMREAGFGRIVNISSVAGKEGNPNAAPYAASKAGLIGMTKALAREVATDGILVNAVAPGVIGDVDFRELDEYILARTPMQRRGKPSEVADLVAWICSDECSFTTGAVFDVSGGRASY